MYKSYERPPLVLNGGAKLFAVNAGYRKTDVGTNWYAAKIAITATSVKKSVNTASSISHPKKKVGMAKPIMMIEENNHESNKAIQ